MVTGYVPLGEKKKKLQVKSRRHLWDDCWRFLLHIFITNILTKHNNYDHQNLAKGLQLTFSTSFGLYMFCRTTRENISKCTIKKAHLSKTKAKPNQKSKLGQNTSGGGTQAQPATH
jgi:hypothetical protein